MTTPRVPANGNARKYFENRILHDLEDYVEVMHPGFELVGDGDIGRIASVLGQNSYNNIIYSGPSGVGKTANLLGIARRKTKALADLDHAGDAMLPFHMVERRLLLLDVNTLFDTSDPKKIQDAIREMFDELRKPGEHVLVIEDANDFLNGVRNHHCHGLISSFMRELKKGGFQTVWMVREEPGKNKLEEVVGCHSDMAELFTVLRKEPPGQDETLAILRATRPLVECHFDGLTITEEAEREIASLTFAYPALGIYMREQPARSLRLRDHIASTFVSRMQARPAQLDALEREKSDLETRQETAEGQDRAALLERQGTLANDIQTVHDEWSDRAKKLYYAYGKRRQIENRLEAAEISVARLTADLTDRLREELGRAPGAGDIDNRKTQAIREAESDIRNLRRDLEDKVLPALRRIKGEHNTALTLEVSDVKDLFSEIAGIPVNDLDDNELEKVLNLDARLKEKVLGQDHAVDAITGSVVRSKARSNRTRPIGSYVLLGSSGIGKSFIAESLAELLFDDSANLTVFDMSEFMEKHTVSRLIGAPPGYAGYGEGGKLTNAVREKPHQVVLLDEIEKAHPDVFKILLQVLDKGRLSDELGTVDFRNTIVIMTTNLAQHLSLVEDLDPESESTETEVKTALRQVFPQELINRVDGFPLLKSLQPEVIHKILRRKVESGNKEFREDGIVVELPDDDIAEIVADRYRPEEGARQVQRFLEKKLETQIDKAVLQMRSRKEGGVIRASYDPRAGGFTIAVAATPETAPAEMPDNVTRFPPGNGIAPGGMSEATRILFAPSP
ncbi:MAG: ATP-dependent Clp protease ATP-binding subunit [Alphaproteobacteria bacterium]|nr:ATP-dependent Clp protease ATP-binding subunit [Alphaproteobacteria bacterium]